MILDKILVSGFSINTRASNGLARATIIKQVSDLATVRSRVERASLWKQMMTLVVGRGPS